MSLLSLVNDLSQLPEFPWRVEGGKLLSQQGDVLAEHVDVGLWNFLATAPATLRRLAEELAHSRAINKRLRKSSRAGLFTRELHGKRHHP